MATIIEELIEVFDKQIVLYKDLLAIGGEKRHIIINNDIDTLGTMNTVENNIISKINRLEKQRISVMKDICDILSIDINKVTLKELANALNNEEDKMKVLKIRDDLNNIIEELNQVNELNKNLIESSLDFVNFSINTIKSTKQPMDTGYENDLKGKK